MTAARRILVVQPFLVGDAVIATPMLRALRRRFPESHVTYLLRHQRQRSS
ncbi:MAG: glycosyltransferase family 9 protein [Phycisphaerae bacterium]